ncbi:MAG: exonuclease domain-containing protein [Gammaproteobacteria bacterium]|nr:exonuclease domain-containing protein [Gammaproteobacteria bacterium]
MISIKFQLNDPDTTITNLRENRGKQGLSLEDVAGCGMTFNAVDVETANSDRSTICQIGIAHVVDGQISDRWSTLVNPEDEFDDFNISIHGITAKQVQRAPALLEVREELRQRLRGQVLVSHTSFDRSAFETAMDKYGLDQLQVYWLDSAKVVRRAWPEEFCQRGYGLKNVAHYIGYEFKHHDALEDAVAAAEITLTACREHNVDIEYWIRKIEEEIYLKKKRERQPQSQKSVARKGNPDGELAGEALLFTGELQMRRPEAADYAAFMGCDVKTGFSKKITILVSGIQTSPNIKSPSGKSEKHIKAEELISRGYDIKIISETDFLSLIANHQPPVPLQTLAAEKAQQK